ncbi:MAG: DUF1684 domain-containing protein [Bacteroidota bacterium]
MKLTAAYILILGLFGSIYFGCKNRTQEFPALTAQDSVRIIQEIMDHRTEINTFFQDDPNSPFRKDSDAHFDSIKWFAPNLKYYFRSQLYKYSNPQTVVVFGTKGEKRNELRYGYFKLIYNDNEYRLNVYKTLPSEEEPSPEPNYLSVWFTDATTGNQTYGVGRYIEVGEEQTNPDAVYIIDLNNAFNPYCAYSSIYSCAIPRKEDHLDFPVIAGELKYHP